jgi:phosphatidylserine/phosphatidylglycerophosphate/cardiolipin synthase-like enzyme
MADFLTTSGTSYQIERIIIEAKSQLVLISPYLQLSKTFFERLRDASNKNVPIKIVYGKDELKPNEKNSLAELKGVELFFFENLHAKCYYNESSMVITSMNMYEFSEKNNREMGVLIEKNNDNILYGKAVDEALSIIKSSEQIQLKKSTRPFPKESKKGTDGKNRKPDITHRGYCIRCEARIPYNTERPLCADCYSTWSKYGDPDYEENVCHRFGEYEESSMRKPLCYDCYKEEAS